MESWKRNLIVCWFGMFVTMIGMSQIAPVLPLYIKQLGIHDTSLIEELSGIAFGVTYIISAIFSPIWGKLADKVGRKPMLLRASLGMVVVVFRMGFVVNVYELIGLRLLQGVISGYSTACTTLIATQTDKKNAGYALGTLSTATIAGTLLGPMIGGYLEETLGFQSVFLITGGLLLIAFVITFLFVKESFIPSNKRVPNIKEVWRLISHPEILIISFGTSFILQLALYSIEPIITVYITQLVHNSVHVTLIAGAVFSSAGLATILFAPRVGRLSDEIGGQKVILVELIAAGLIFIPQAFVRSPWQLMALRFLLGISTAGLTPSIIALVKKITPEAITGRIFGVAMSVQYLGIFGGFILGGK